MSTFVRASVCSILAVAAVGCTAHASVQAQPPPPPQATIVVAAAPAPPPPVPPPPPPVAAPAPPPAAHPAYLHALTDLRNARWNLARRGGDPNMRWDEHFALEAVDRAIAEIKRAAIDDGKNIEDHPHLDAKEPWAGRLHKALAALQAARKDVDQEEDNAYAQGLKARAIHHIDEALHLTEKGIVGM